MNTAHFASGSQAASELSGINDVLTIAETAALLRCSKAHVQNLLAGKVRRTAPLPYIPLGRRKLIRRDSLLRWMETSESRC